MSTSSLDPASIPDPRPSGSAKALVKGLALVDLVAGSDRPMRLVDLVDASGLPRPTALRLLDVLCRAEVLRTDPAGAYSLGPRVAAWGQSFLHRLDLRAQAVDLMQEMVDITGETCFLGVLDAGRILYLAVVNSPQPVRPAAQVGFRNPLHCTGIGKVLLAHRSDAEMAELLTEPLEQRTPNTITDVGELRAQLAEVRARGYAIDDVENEDGVRCLAGPVRDHTGAVIAGLSVSAPAYRFSLADLAALTPAVVRVTRELSGRLGYVDPLAADPEAATPADGEGNAR